VAGGEIQCFLTCFSAHETLIPGFSIIGHILAVPPLGFSTTSMDPGTGENYGKILEMQTDIHDNPYAYACRC